MSHSNIKKPSLYHFFTELPRAFWSFIQGYRYLNNLPSTSHSQPQPVLVIPGLLTNDSSTWLLRKYLAKRGYDSYGWNNGWNLANVRDLQLLKDKINDLQSKYNTKIILMGWSLGGIYARHLSKNHSDQIEKVITLGSPYMGVNQPNRAHGTIKILKRGKGYDDREKKMIKGLNERLPIPNYAVYSKNDGIVPWQVCYEENGDELHHSYEVGPGHFGMGVSRELFRIFDNIL